MIARGFKSVIWVATVGSAALGCYMVSLRVATERNELAKVERQIIEARRDIRSLQTELGTRGRMTQLEQWNAEVLALSAPSSAQFLKDEFTLARLYRNDPTVAERSAEVRLASAEAPAAKPGRGCEAGSAGDRAGGGRAPAAAAAADPPRQLHSGRAGRQAGGGQARAGRGRPRRRQAEQARAERTASAAPDQAPTTGRPEPSGGHSRPPSRRRLRSEPPPSPRDAAAPPPSREPAARPAAAKPAAAAAKPVREAAAAPRQAKVKGSGGN